MRRRLAVQALWALAALLVACGSDTMPVANGAPEPAEGIPGLSPDDELVAFSIPPHPSDASFQWTQAVKVADLPAVNIGHPTPGLMGGSDGNARFGITCTGSAGNANCVPVQNARPLIAGERFTGRDVMTWVWVGVPEEALAVQFTDLTGGTVWQQPVSGVVMFPDVVREDGACHCRLDAFNGAGQIIAAVDVTGRSYIDL